MIFRSVLSINRHRATDVWPSCQHDRYDTIQVRIRFAADFRRAGFGPDHEVEKWGRTWPVGDARVGTRICEIHKKRAPFKQCPLESIRESRTLALINAVHQLLCF